jgi:hypothetical protein
MPRVNFKSILFKRTDFANIDFYSCNIHRNYTFLSLPMSHDPWLVAVLVILDKDNTDVLVFMFIKIHNFVVRCHQSHRKKL